MRLLDLPRQGATAAMDAIQRSPFDTLETLLSPAHRRSCAIGARRPPCRPRPTRSVDPLADGVGGLGAVEDARGPLAAAVLVADLPAGLGWRGDGGIGTIQAMYHLRRVRTHQDGLSPALLMDS